MVIVLNSSIPFCLNVKFSCLMGIKAVGIWRTERGWSPCPQVSVSYSSYWLMSNAGAVQVCPAHLQPLTFSGSISAHQKKSLQLVVLIVLNSTLFTSLLTSFTKEKLPLYTECKLLDVLGKEAAFWPATGWKAAVCLLSHKAKQSQLSFYFVLPFTVIFFD